jgi:uncharacterized membrane protein YjjP (DUF1212 family)
MKNQRSLLITVLFSIAGAIVGILVAFAFYPVLITDPVWVGPAMVVAGVGALVVGVLLIPSAIRAYRGKGAS